MTVNNLRKHYDSLTLLQRLALADNALGRSDDSEALAIKNASPRITFTQSDFSELYDEILRIRMFNLVTRLVYIINFDFLLQMETDFLIDKSNLKAKKRINKDLKLGAFLYVRATDSWNAINTELGLRPNFDDEVMEHLSAIDLFQSKDKAMGSVLIWILLCGSSFVRIVSGFIRKLSWVFPRRILKKTLWASFVIGFHCHAAFAGNDNKLLSLCSSEHTIYSDLRRGFIDNLEDGFLFFVDDLQSRIIGITVPIQRFSELIVLDGNSLVPVPGIDIDINKRLVVLNTRSHKTVAPEMNQVDAIFFELIVIEGGKVASNAKGNLVHLFAKSGSFQVFWNASPFAIQVNNNNSFEYQQYCRDNCRHPYSEADEQNKKANCDGGNKPSNDFISVGMGNEPDRAIELFSNKGKFTLHLMFIAGLCWGIALHKIYIYRNTKKN
mgnify:CR=1 FL=1